MAFGTAKVTEVFTARSAEAKEQAVVSESAADIEAGESQPSTEVNSQAASILSEKLAIGRDPAFLVHLDPPESPKHLSSWRKWIIVLVVSTSALCATCTSSMVRFCLCFMLVEHCSCYSVSM